MTKLYRIIPIYTKNELAFCFWDVIIYNGYLEYTGLFQNGAALFIAVVIMTEKLTRKQFAKSICKDCIWLRKADQLHYFCPFRVCFREMEYDYAEKLKKEMMRHG